MMPGSCFIEDSPRWQNGLQRLTQAVVVSAANLGRPTLERRDVGVLCRAADRDPVEPDDHRRVRLGRAAQIGRPARSSSRSAYGLLGVFGVPAGATKGSCRKFFTLSVLL